MGFAALQQQRPPPSTCWCQGNNSASAPLFSYQILMTAVHNLWWRGEQAPAIPTYALFSPVGGFSGGWGWGVAAVWCQL